MSTAAGLIDFHTEFIFDFVVRHDSLDEILHGSLIEPRKRFGPLVAILLFKIINPYVAASCVFEDWIEDDHPARRKDPLPEMLPVVKAEDASPKLEHSLRCEGQTAASIFHVVGGLPNELPILQRFDATQNAERGAP